MECAWTDHLSLVGQNWRRRVIGSWMSTVLRVQAITIRETRVKTFDGQLIVIPNRDVYKNVIGVQMQFDDRRFVSR